MGKRLIVNTALMTSASLLMRCIAMGFQGYLSGRIGAAGIGLYPAGHERGAAGQHLCDKRDTLRGDAPVSEELGMGRAGGVHGAMVRSALYALIFGSAAMLLLTRFAEPVGFLWIGDARTVMSLRILAFGLPCLALSSVISGYFTACGRIWKPSLVHLIEQCAVVVFVALFLERAPEGDIELSCAAVCAGVTASDMLSLALMLAFYLGDRRKYGSRTGESIRLTGRMLSVALPLAVSAYARSALSTLEHLLVPRGFRKSGLSADAGSRGLRRDTGHGPCRWLSFPSCLLSSLAENVIPELTGAQVRGEREKIRREVRSLLTMSLLFAIAVAFALFVTSDFIGSALFASSEAGPSTYACSRR